MNWLGFGILLIFFSNIFRQLILRWGYLAVPPAYLLMGSCFGVLNAAEEIQSDLNHPAPIVIKASEIRSVINYPSSQYRMFSLNKSGQMQAIPFQIDEIDPWGDFILPFGPESHLNKQYANGIFDGIDELSFMGPDMGIEGSPPDNWGFRKPDLIHKLAFRHEDGNTGAVFLGIYYRTPPEQAHSIKNYVVWNIKDAQITTNRYRYRFDPKNYLVVRGVDVARKDSKGEFFFEPIIDSSTMAVKVDLKYFVTLNLNHRDLNSRLDAYKSGPIRSIIRVSFTYKLLNIKFELGMYTEISFFANAVFLPAIFYNPVDGPKRLNKGSGFYYGFNTFKSTDTLNLTSNMPDYQTPGILTNLFSHEKNADTNPSRYWVIGNTDKELIYMSLVPSQSLLRQKVTPHLYKEKKGASETQARFNKGKDLALGQGPVNLALFFDLTKFSEGEHQMAFQLLFENYSSDQLLSAFKKVGKWQYSVEKISH